MGYFFSPKQLKCKDDSSAETYVGRDFKLLLEKSLKTSKHFTLFSCVILTAALGQYINPNLHIEKLRHKLVD